jgi:uncharacterized membrane protein
MKKLIKVLYAGDGYDVTFGFHMKGCTIGLHRGFTWSPRYEQFRALYTKLKDVLRMDPNIDVTYINPEDACTEFPSKIEDLMKYNVLILSDIKLNGLVSLSVSSLNDEASFFVDREEQIISFVEKGGGLICCGGETSFQGREQRGMWWTSPIKQILPIEILPVPDDTFYSSEGFKIKILEPEHELIKDIPWDTCPRFFGYNMVGKPKKDANLLATIGYPGEEKDPCLVEWTYGKGRVLAFTSDPVPTWGEDFSKWKYYQKFWTNTIKWLTKKPKEK